MNLKEKIKGLFQRTSKNPFTGSSSIPRVKDVSSSRRRIRVPRLLGIKRVIAGLNLMMNGLLFLMALTDPSSLMLGLIFMPTCFIMIDYLWRTRKPSREWNN